MRYLASLAALLVTIFPGTHAATAATAAKAADAVTLAPVAIGQSLQNILHSQFGDAEGQVLQQAVSISLVRSLKRAGAALGTPDARRLEVLISDARPSHPTRLQMDQNPAMDPIRSRSLGGASLAAVLRGADGHEIDRVSWSHYAATFDTAALAYDPWADARLAIDMFATQVARSYQRHTQAFKPGG